MGSFFKYTSSGIYSFAETNSDLSAPAFPTLIGLFPDIDLEDFTVPFLSVFASWIVPFGTTESLFLNADFYPAERPFFGVVAGGDGAKFSFPYEAFNALNYSFTRRWIVVFIYY